MHSYDSSVDGNVELFCTNCPYDLISTKYVELEVNGKIGMKNPTNHNLFFLSKKQEALKLKKKIFENIRIIDIKNNKLMDLLQSTRPRNPGEQSLVVLLSSKYADYVNSSTNSVRIISNNSKDIFPP